MSTVPEKFTRKGWTFRQVDRLGQVAVYERRKPGTRHWEVVRLRRYPAFEKGGKEFPAGESYPGNERWGSDGWTFMSEAAAWGKYAGLA